MEGVGKLSRVTNDVLCPDVFDIDRVGLKSLTDEGMACDSGLACGSSMEGGHRKK